MKEQAKSVVKMITLFTTAFALMVVILFLTKRGDTSALLASLGILVVELVLIGAAIVEANKIKARRANKGNQDH